MMHNGMPMPPLSQVEHMVLTKLRVFNIPLIAPMPIERIVQSFGASIVALSSLRTHQIEAAIRRVRCRGCGTQILVFIDRAIMDGQLSYYNFALAEEAGHLLLDFTEIMSVKTIEDFVEIHQRPDWLQRERHREAVGRIWLAPRPLLEQVVSRCYAHVADESGFGQAFLGSLHALCAKELQMPIDQIPIRIRECGGDLEERIDSSRTERRATLKKDLYERQKRPVRKQVRGTPLLDQLEGETMDSL